jgi:hypothetical protein
MGSQKVKELAEIFMVDAGILYVLMKNVFILKCKYTHVLHIF